MKNPIEYITQAVKFYFEKGNFIFFAKVMAILTIISTSLGLLSNYLYPVNIYENLDYANFVKAGGFILLSLVMILFGIFTKSTTLESVIKANTDIKAVYKKGWKKMWKYFLASLVLGLIIIGGLILLVVPGIMFAIWFSFTLFLVFDKDLPVKQALKDSKAMVKGRFWKVLGRFIVIGIFGMIVTIVIGSIPSVGSILLNFLAPLLLLPMYFLYKDLLA